MLFTGYSQHSIDSKLRLAIPAKYRNQWDSVRDGNAWFCIPWPTGLLRLYTEAQFTQLARSMGSTLMPDANTAELQAGYFGFAERLEMDAAGRVTLLKKHLELTGLGTEVVVVGAMDRLEVRNKATWEADQREVFKRLQERADELAKSRPTSSTPSTGPAPFTRPPMNGHAGG
ncbi:MAG: division/cell wall cluster transcriptional repressor MraZ [Phycisphaerales bacterium]